MPTLLEDTISRARLWLREFQRPVILWSGGKDSTVLLHILRWQMGLRLPCVQWREPRFRHRYAYSDALIAEWNLEVHDYPPLAISLASGPCTATGRIRFDIVKQYQVGLNTAAMCLGTEPPTDSQLSSGDYLCALDDVLLRPTGHFNFPWDAVFHGHKNSDTDLIKGTVPLANHILRAEGQATALFLLRDWSDQDIFDYLERHAIPIDPTRYIKTEAGWVNNPDKSQNADFYPACFNCVNRHAGPSVHCPKLRATVNNISHLAPYIDLSIPEQGVHSTWKQNTTANPAEPAAPTNGAGPSCAATAATPSTSRRTTNASTTPCSKPPPAAAASPSEARSATPSPAPSTSNARTPAGHSSQAAHSV
jgi:hypothetical protein